MDMHDHSIAWMIAGGSRAAQERDRAFVRAANEARSTVARPTLADRLRAYVRGTTSNAVATADCCTAPTAA